jgi:hypothetical protein
MKRMAISSALILSLVFSAINPAIADNANPPKIVSVEQVTKGPYTIGDIVTFKINYTGGNPGIKGIEIRGAGSRNTCLSQSANLISRAGFVSLFPLASVKWEKGKSIATPYSSSSLVSGFIIPCDQNRDLWQVSILDETGLTDSISWGPFSTGIPSYLVVESIPTDFNTPIGEIKPKKIGDKVLIKNIPKTPKVGSKYELPRVTQGGLPIYWNAGGGCVIEYQTFLIDIGGTLKITKPLACNLRAEVLINDKFNSPQYSANIKFQGLKGGNSTSTSGVYKAKK